MSTTKTPKLETTRNYAGFVSNAEQRPVIEGHVKKLAESMKDFGFLPSKPIQVRKDGGKFCIIDGHHRFAAAKSLGIALWFVVEPESSQVTLAPVNALVKTWGIADFVRMYASRGMRDYQEILSYVEKGIPINMVASLLHGESAGSGNAGDLIKHGTFKVRDRSNIAHVAELIESHGEVNAVVKHRSFIDAFSRCLFTPDFDVERFKRRFETNPLMVGKASNVDLQLDQLEELYNFRSQDKWPLAFHVRETSARRKLASMGNGELSRKKS